MFRVSEGRPNVIDLINENNVGWIISTPSTGAEPQKDEVRIRSHAVLRGIPVTTTSDGLRAGVQGIESLQQQERIEVCSLQEYHRHAPQLNLQPDCPDDPGEPANPTPSGETLR